jgi:hypothetical protein
MDFVLVLIPWYLLWGVNMRTLEKIGVCIAMSFGILYVRIVASCRVAVLPFLPSCSARRSND